MSGGAFSMPVLAVGRDKDGLPERITVPGGLTHHVPLLSAGEQLGRVEQDGDIGWNLNVFSDAPAAKQARIQLRSRRLRAVFHDGEVIAVVAYRR